MHFSFGGSVKELQGLHAGVPFWPVYEGAFLKLLGSVMNNIEHNFTDIMSAKRILQWRAAV